MGINKYKWHLHILSEDDATRELGNGLALSRHELSHAIQTLPESRGWKRTVARIDEEKLDKYEFRRVLLIIDFDKSSTRLAEIKAISQVERFHDRIFIIGSFFEAEDLKRHFKKGLEDIGKTLGQECTTWANEYLRHSHSEICRLSEDIKAHFSE